MKEDILNKLENIKEVKMENKNKEYLLKIIQLHDYIKKKKIIEEIIKEIENKKINEEDLFFIDIRINSILEEDKKKNYNEKISNETLTLYKYEDKNIIYIKKKDKIQKILDSIVKLEYKFLHLYKENEWIKKKELSKIKLSDLENIDKVVNSTL